ncbi:B-cell linker protein-like isoform X3 [Myxocyprinus asiaticus]|uniref:B-cell linker protein-like isoform X3 n=1 Tax=Myxocyprinus asiaticus TaxID=70543 RepID=UPI002221A769|nr:B-cell linker protein-like isoform X3 [Myxocyprinus asiaticus]
MSSNSASSINPVSMRCLTSQVFIPEYSTLVNTTTARVRNSYRMEHLNKITAPATVKLRQLQKIVQDIKKNDDSLFNRLKRFQSEQTAHILKTGRNTLDRIRKKGPPKVPARDYPGEAHDIENSSDSFESDTYEELGDNDNSYEPPPRSEGHNLKAFTISASITNPRGQYLDSCRGRPLKPHKPLHPQQRNKPPQPTKSSTAKEEHEVDDYIELEDELDDDNYIDPTKKTPTKPPVNPGIKPCVPARANSPDFCKVPNMEGNSQSEKRSNMTLQPNTQMAPPKASPRMHIRKPTMTQEPQSEDEYEVCDTDDSVNERLEESTESRKLSIPTPRPREMKKSSPALMPKRSVPQQDNEATQTVMPRSPPDIMTPTPTTGFHRAKIPLPRQFPSQSRGMLPPENRASRDAEEEAGVYNKIWYASICDRRTAEDALKRSAKDGSFLLRKSSGMDAQQPYTLVVFYNSRVYNIPVRHIASTKQYALGKEKHGEERFNSVSEIIENHQNNPLVLLDSQNNTKDSTKLKHPVKP